MIDTLLKEIDQLQAKINSYRPLKSEQLAAIKEYYRIGLTYTSNALEGNSLTETETKIALEDGLTVAGKPLRDYFEAIGHSDAYDFLNSCAQHKGFNIEQILQFHRLFYYRIDEQHAGVYRDCNAVITGSKYALPKPDEISQLMQEFVTKYGISNYTMHPAVWAACVHKEFVFIHPFIDGNGRVARLLMNLVLLQAGYVVTVIPPVVRRDYIAALEAAHIDDHNFIELIARMVKETQQDYLRLFA